MERLIPLLCLALVIAACKKDSNIKLLGEPAVAPYKYGTVVSVLAENKGATPLTLFITADLKDDSGNVIDKISIVEDIPPRKQEEIYAYSPKENGKSLKITQIRAEKPPE